MALDLNYDPELLPFLLLAAAFLLRYWGAVQTAPAFSCALELLAMTAYLALGAYIHPPLLLAAALLFIPVAFAAVYRAVHAGAPHRVLRLAGTLIGYFAMLGLWMTLIRIPGALLETGMPFFRIFADARFWAGLGGQIRAACAALTAPAAVYLAIFSLPLQLYALFSAAACVWLAAKRRDVCAGLMAWLFAAGTALWALGIAPPVFGSLLPAVYLWSRWLRRSRGAVFGIVLLLACALAGDILLFLL